MANIDINQLANEITRTLSEYSSEVEENLEIAKKEVAQEAVKELKQKSPKLTRSYAKGWRLKKDRTRYIVHNATDYQLTHLLEYGHIKSGGGRVPAKVHIRPVEEKAVKDFGERVERMIRI